jgi:hypothetical protein
MEPSVFHPCQSSPPGVIFRQSRGSGDEGILKCPTIPQADGRVATAFVTHSGGRLSVKKLCPSALADVNVITHWTVSA